ncbi:PREDICTED: uncharacterized protein LOC104762506 isoform X2 [Camelina sativa]|uniref:Uncharacterized protein LOC104762506 isoform X2 n=1 Tax=Camelina sativa TaxID=90675 RepID=A0ABM1R8P4_CAMSA|nr:PREDICTED: uncharacterized protein LOC104762506 isoform X2 [Camelina sativa]
MAFAPILRRASAAKNLISLARLAVGSSFSSRSLQTGATGDDSQSMGGYHVSSGGFMRGAVYREPNQPLTIEEFHIPRPKVNEILIKTKACGVCHSDLHVMKGEIPFSSPCVIGHEITGEVVEHGPLTDHKIIKRFPVGSRVVGAFIMPCGTCSYCAKGHDDLCEDFFAYNRAKGTLYDGETRLFLRHDDSPVYMYSMGGMAEYCVTPAHGCLQIARAFGASDIIAVDVQDDKLQKAKTLGATHIVNGAKEDAVERIREITGGMGVDVAVEALGRPQTFMQCTLSVKDGGKAVMIGLSKAGSVGEIDINRLVRRKIKVIGSYGGRARQDLPKVVKLAESGIFNLTNAVSSKYKFEDAGKALQDLNEGKIVSRGVVEIL